MKGYFYTILEKNVGNLAKFFINSDQFTDNILWDLKEISR